MTCKNCKSERVIQSDDGKRYICLSCGDSFSVNDKGETKLDDSFVSDLVNRVSDEVVNKLKSSSKKKTGKEKEQKDEGEDTRDDTKENNDAGWKWEK